MLDIQNVLDKKGMTQKALAKRLGVTVQAVNSVVCCRSVPSERLLKRYADALEVNVESLYSDFL